MSCFSRCVWTWNWGYPLFIVICSGFAPSSSVVHVHAEWEINYNTISTYLSYTLQHRLQTAAVNQTLKPAGEAEPQSLSMMLIWAVLSLLPLQGRSPALTSAFHVLPPSGRREVMAPLS